MCCITVSYFPLRFIKAAVFLFSCGLIACAGISMYWAVKAKRMPVWVAYGGYLPQNLSELSFLLGLVLGSALLMLFILGVLLVTRAKHCIVTCPYGVMTFGIFIAYYLLGILCLAAGFYGSEAIGDYCAGQDLDYWNRFKLFSFVLALDSHYVELDKQLMCTDLCPCLPLSNPLLYSNYTETVSTKIFSSTLGHTSLTPCLSDTDYSTRWNYDLIAYMKQLELRYSCTGLCKPLVFSQFSNYQYGPNENACWSYIAKELDSDMGKMGYVFLSCGSFVFCAWFCQFGLCFRDKEEKAIREHIRQKRVEEREVLRQALSTTNESVIQQHSNGPQQFPNLQFAKMDSEMSPSRSPKSNRMEGKQQQYRGKRKIPITVPESQMQTQELKQSVPQTPSKLNK
ncbi:hypothetical protein FGO68_gene1797 [Halteria grandinella]|uniref:Tetraspanin family protein n=1 Tax=Halteria grandinella TaxID=5974 RepID=A0A8J8NMR4_HALGN|nr:hypothetical protein FGO68_gene1797 [Halteria grandinella]